MIDNITKSWIRNAADERAAANGCWFDLDRACYAVWWIERFCRLYEGEWAGSPLVLRGAYSMPLESVQEAFYTADSFGPGYAPSVQRARDYMDCVVAGESCDWQYECIMRIFGWVRESKRWDRPIRRFNRGGVWVPKKNKKSPTLAAVSLYLLVGDGEPGAKVFLGAKDSTQIRKNVSLHILEMIRQSPELDAECKINMNEMSVVHQPSRSLLMPLSSGSSRSQESKEGLNGSLLIDETHVVDRAFVKRVDRTGISRSEPLFLQFSTAGKDPDSYGKEEFNRGQDVNDGRRADDAYFFAYYGAPQTITDEQLAANPAEIIAAANPALGHTVDIDEAMADYERSRGSLADLADFKTYRLNIWQRSANPWLNMNDWSRCRKDFTKESLYGHVCGGGLDLSQSRDMTAFALVFPEDMEAWRDAYEDVRQAQEDKPEDRRSDVPVKLLTWFWIPEGSVERYKNDVPQLLDWIDQGIVTVVPGAVMEYAVVEEDILQLLGLYDVRMMAYDQRFATQSIQWLQNKRGASEEWCAAFGQSRRQYTGPSWHFDRLIGSGKLHHNGHDILTWQAGHVHRKEWPDKSMVPARPGNSNDDPRKIDGIVASIMALEAAVRMPLPRDSYYSTHTEVWL